MRRPRPLQLNLAEAKKRLSELIGRVAFGGETILITRRGRPMAKLVRPDAPRAKPHLADVSGWLDERDPFFATIDDIVAARRKRRPRVLQARRSRGGR